MTIQKKLIILNMPFRQCWQNSSVLAETITQTDLCEIRHNSCFFSTDDYKPLLPPAKLLPLCQELDTTIKVINRHV